MKDLLGDGFYKKINFSTVLYFIDKLPLSKTVYRFLMSTWKTCLASSLMNIWFGAFTQLRLESQNDKKCDIFEELALVTNYGNIDSVESTYNLKSSYLLCQTKSLRLWSILSKESCTSKSQAPWFKTLHHVIKIEPNNIEPNNIGHYSLNLWVVNQRSRGFEL